MQRAMLSRGSTVEEVEGILQLFRRLAQQAQKNIFRGGYF